MDNKAKNYFGEPTSQIVVRGIDMFITKEDLQNASCSAPTSIETQPPPYHELAVLTFSSASTASAFLENQKEPGTVSIKGKQLLLDYLQPGEGLDLFIAAPKRTKKITDWVCRNCKYKNFARRDLCHLCQAPRESVELELFSNRPISLARKFSADSMEQTIFKYGIFAREVIAVSKVEMVEKDTVRYTFAPVAAVKAVSLRRVEGHPTMAFVEFYTAEDAEEVVERHFKESFTIAGKEVGVILAKNLPTEMKELYEVRLRLGSEAQKVPRYSSGRLERRSRSPSSLRKVRHRSESSSKRRRRSRRRSISYSESTYSESSEHHRSKKYEKSKKHKKSKNKYKNSEKSEKTSKSDRKSQKTAKKMETAMKERFSYDPQSGFFFDKESGYLFDPVTQIYCHGQSKKCFQWNAETKGFDPTEKVGRFGYLLETKNESIPLGKVQGSAIKIINSALPAKKSRAAHLIPIRAPTAATTKKTPKTNITKGEKKAQKFSKFGRIARQATHLKNMARAEQIGHGVVVGHKDFADPKTDPKTPVLSQSAPKIEPKTAKETAPQKAGGILGGPEFEFAGRKDFFDYGRIACLLCKRGFRSLDVMKRHATESELHKKNIKIFEIKKAARDKLRAPNQFKPNRTVQNSQPIPEPRRDDLYRSNLKTKTKQRFLSPQNPPAPSPKPPQNAQNSAYLTQMKQFDAQNCSEKVGTPNAIVK